jgi:hypothetical protein
MWQELIPAGVRKLGNEPFGTEFREVVSERGECVALGSTADRFNDRGVEFCSGEGIACCDMRERTSACMRASCRG